MELREEKETKRQDIVGPLVLVGERLVSLEARDRNRMRDGPGTSF